MERIVAAPMTHEHYITESDDKVLRFITTASGAVNVVVILTQVTTEIQIDALELRRISIHAAEL